MKSKTNTRHEIGVRMGAVIRDTCIQLQRLFVGTLFMRRAPRHLNQVLANCLQRSLGVKVDKYRCGSSKSSIPALVNCALHARIWRMIPLSLVQSLSYIKHGGCFGVTVRRITASCLYE